jgi:uncharacterized delta-60 repeat protein
VQPDGRILVGGARSESSAPAIMLYRLEPDGSMDTTFTGLPGIDQVLAVESLPDGDILVGCTIWDHSLIRLNSDGSVDSAFPYDDVGGVGNLGGSFIKMPDGRILVGGHTFLNPDGTVDNTYTVHATGELICAAVQPDGKVVLGGDFEYTYIGSDPDHSIIRLNPDGSLDQSFNDGSGLFGSIGAGNTAYDPYALMIQDDGKIIIAGDFISYDEVNSPYLVRVNPDGSFDPSFNHVMSPEWSPWDTIGPDYRIFKLIPMNDGTILACGEFRVWGGEQRPGIVRFFAD